MFDYQRVYPMGIFPSAHQGTKRSLSTFSARTKADAPNFPGLHRCNSNTFKPWWNNRVMLHLRSATKCYKFYYFVGWLRQISKRFTFSEKDPNQKDLPIWGSVVLPSQNIISTTNVNLPSFPLVVKKTEENNVFFFSQKSEWLFTKTNIWLVK